MVASSRHSGLLPAAGCHCERNAQSASTRATRQRPAEQVTRGRRRQPLGQLSRKPKNQTCLPQTKVGHFEFPAKVLHSRIWISLSKQWRAVFYGLILSNFVYKSKILSHGSKPVSPPNSNLGTVRQQKWRGGSFVNIIMYLLQL